MAAFDDGLAFTENGEIAMKTISHSELLGGTYDVHVLAVPDENAGFAGTDEDIAEFALVDVHAGC